MDRLTEILQNKQSEVEKLLPRADKLRVAALARNDFRSLRSALSGNEQQLGIIAEVKKASPSAGVICSDFNPEIRAKLYAQAGANAISVLTDEKFFHGSLDHLTLIRRATSLPILRKDFIINPAQIYESAVAGADAILLIVAALQKNKIEELIEIARTCQLEVLCEIHNLAELDIALQIQPDLIGINNRDLSTFKVDLKTTEKLAEEIPEDMPLVSESGIRTYKDAAQVFTAGADAVLIGEALMRQSDPTEFIKKILAIRALPATENSDSDITRTG